MKNKIEKRRWCESDKRWEVTYNIDPVCPYCGHVARDAWEIDFSDGMEGSIDDFECGSCEKEFRLERHVRISYSSFSKPDSKTEDQGPGSKTT
jgi:hypothetical protein